MTEKERQGHGVSLALKRMAILNTLPAPMAEHLRKLMVPVEAENKGFDKISEARLHQIVKTYQVIAELIIFTLLAQIWETYFEKGRLELPPEKVEEVIAFMRMPPKQQEIFNYVGLIRSIREIIDANSENYFVKEITDLRKFFYREGPVQQASFFLEVLKVKLSKHSIDPKELPDLCIRAEESLANILSKMGFLAKYTLTAIQDIDILKFRHSKEAVFKHKIVYLHNLLGGLDINYLELKSFTDNRSVLLMDEDRLKFLNLTPFILDANAFEDNTDVSKIYFISHYEPQSDSYYYKYVNKPENKLDFIQISEEKFNIIKIQLDAFFKLLTPESTD